MTRLAGSVYLFGYTRNLIFIHDALTSRGFRFRQSITIDKGIKVLAGRATRKHTLFPTITEQVWFYQRDSRPFIRQTLRSRAASLGLSAKEINRRMGVATNGGGLYSFYASESQKIHTIPTRERWAKLCAALEINDIPYEAIAPAFHLEAGLTDVWRDFDFYTRGRIHATQKPLALIERILAVSSDTGQVVLDPFSGSGTTAVAAAQMGRRCVAIEKDAAYARSSQARLDEVVRARP